MEAAAAAMDFHALSHRELQALCKRNGVRANMTNAAMAEALQGLASVSPGSRIRFDELVRFLRLRPLFSSSPAICLDGIGCGILLCVDEAFGRRDGR